MLRHETVTPETLGLIRELQTEPLLANFHLVGGTGLALQIGHRLSIDIDLFTREPFDSDRVMEMLITKHRFQRSFQAPHTLKGFCSGVMLDLVRHDYEEFEVLLEDGIRMLSMQDIAAMKLNAIVGDGTRVKDFIDIYFLLDVFPLEDMVRFYCRKYKQDDALIVLRCLAYFDDTSVADWPRLLRQPEVSFEQIKERLRLAVKKVSS
jgi:hypothetical protein